jgi:hypothetical protein
MHTTEMNQIHCVAAVLPFLLASVPIPAPAQAMPETPADPQTRAFWDAQGKAMLDELTMKILQGRPAVAIMGMASISGAPSKLTNASVTDSVELTLRRNGIPIVTSCESGSNCGRLVSAIRAKCIKDLFPPNPAGGPTGVCSIYFRVEYRESVSSRRSSAVPAGSFGEIWADDGLGLMTDTSFEESAGKALTGAVEKFALSYLKANPIK